MAATRGGGLDNPFRQPTDEEVFFMRDQERIEKEQLKSRLQYQKVHEKTTASARIGTASTTNVSGVEGSRDRTRMTQSQGHSPNLARDVQKDKENMADFIVKKREMGLIRMSLATKRAEIQKLESEAERAEKRIKQQEEQLEETSQKFDHFIKDNDMKAVEAMKKAEAESKGKNEKSGEIKKLNAYNAAVGAEKVKFEEQLNACLRYKHDLDRLTPDQWFRDSLVNIRVGKEKERLVNKVRVEYDEMVAQEGTNEDGTEIEPLTEELIEQKISDELAAFQKQVADDVSNMLLSPEDAPEGEPQADPLDTVKGQLDAMDPNEVPMFFVDPEKILEIFVEIEENNLFLIQNCQETEQSLEELKAKYEESRQKMDRQVAQLKSQIEIERQKIAVEEARRKNLQQRSQTAKEARGQDTLLDDIKTSVQTIYRNYMEGDDERGRDSLGIMTQIETKLEELKKYIDKHIPNDAVTGWMKQQDKSRRDRWRTEKRNKDRKKQQDRADQVLKRAFQSVKKRVGKPVMWRSKPEEKKRETTVQQEQQEDDGEEFFL